MKPRLSVCAALLGATFVALSVWFGGGDSPSVSRPALANSADTSCAADEVCRPIVRVDANGEPVTDGVAGASTTVVRISPVSQKVDGGAEFDVEVWVDDVENLGAYEFEIQYDWSAIVFKSVENSTFLESSGRTKGFCPPPLLSESRIRYACATLGAEPGVDGTGLLATVTFTACAGSSVLALTESTTLGDRDGDSTAIIFTTQDGSVEVNGGAACPTPTATQEPTVVATGTAEAPPTLTPTPTSDEPDPTPTPTVVAATATVEEVTPAPGTPTPSPEPTPDIPSTPGPDGTWTPVPTWTPAPTWTPVPTWTPDGGPPTPTNSPVPNAVLGDVNCDGSVGPEDATLILQVWAGVLDELPCPEAADANGNGQFELIDATIILQFTIGMVASLPPQ